GHDRTAFGSGNIRRDEQIGVGKFGRVDSSGCEYLHTPLAQPCEHRFAAALGAARDERPKAMQFEIVTYERISSDTILLPSSPKMNRSSMGLPGKFPVSRLVTVILSPF